MVENIRVLVIGDPHFHKDEEKRYRQMVEHTISIAEYLKPDLIVNLGDTLNRHEMAHSLPHSMAIEWMAKLKDIAPLLVLIGNHDMSNTKEFFTKQHHFTALKYWNNTTVADSLVSLKIKNYNFLGVPYVKEGRFSEALQGANLEEVTAIFAHQEFTGCSYNNRVSTKGDKWNENLPLVISGHIHDYHQLQKNILYVGTPIQHHFGDSDNKGIALITFNSGIKIERYAINAQKKKIVTLSANEITSFQPEENTIYKIILTGQPTEIAISKKHPHVLSWMEQGHIISEKVDRIDNTVIKNFEDKMNVKSYHQTLYELIKDNPPVFDAYKEIFGSLKNS